MTYEKFLEISAQYDKQMSECELILKAAKKGEMGLTLDSEKTPEWKRAKQMFQLVFNAYRKLNQDNKAHIKRRAKEECEKRYNKL